MANAPKTNLSPDSPLAEILREAEKRLAQSILRGPEARIDLVAVPVREKAPPGKSMGRGRIAELTGLKNPSAVDSIIEMGVKDYLRKQAMRVKEEVKNETGVDITLAVNGELKRGPSKISIEARANEDAKEEKVFDAERDALLKHSQGLVTVEFQREEKWESRPTFVNMGLVLVEAKLIFKLKLSLAKEGLLKDLKIKQGLKSGSKPVLEAGIKVKEDFITNSGKLVLGPDKEPNLEMSQKLDLIPKILSGNVSYNFTKFPAEISYSVSTDQDPVPVFFAKDWKLGAVGSVTLVGKIFPRRIDTALKPEAKRAFEFADGLLRRGNPVFVLTPSGARKIISYDEIPDLVFPFRNDILPSLDRAIRFNNPSERKLIEMFFQEGKGPKDLINNLLWVAVAIGLILILKNPPKGVLQPGIPPLSPSSDTGMI